MARSWITFHTRRTCTLPCRPRPCRCSTPDRLHWDQQDEMAEDVRGYQRSCKRTCNHRTRTSCPCPRPCRCSTPDKIQQVQQGEMAEGVLRCPWLERALMVTDNNERDKSLSQNGYGNSKI